MSQSNELLEKVRADRAERAAKRKEQQRRNRLILLGAAGAVVVLTVILCLIFIRPAPVSDPTDHRFASSYFAMYAKDGKLFADFTASGKTMALCIHTDDISKVDFRDFALRPVAY